MRFWALCNNCHFNNQYINSDDPYFHSGELVKFEVTDNNVYEYTCPYGHQNVLIRSEEKFELLFEYAMNAIVDEYYREAVASIQASLERFYEFTITVLAVSNNIHQEEITKSWKNISNQSERQVGAFIYSYLNNFKRAPEVLSTASAGFRNNVIHKGYFPTRSETISFGEEVLKVIFSSLIPLRTIHQETINKIAVDRGEKAGAAALKIAANPIGISDAIFFNIIVNNSPKPYLDIEEYVNHLKARR